MVKKFLDQVGLTTLWNTITSEFRKRDIEIDKLNNKPVGDKNIIENVRLGPHGDSITAQPQTKTVVLPVQDGTVNTNGLLSAEDYNRFNQVIEDFNNSTFKITYTYDIIGERITNCDKTYNEIAAKILAKEHVCAYLIPSGTNDVLYTFYNPYIFDNAIHFWGQKKVKMIIEPIIASFELLHNNQNVITIKENNLAFIEQPNSNDHHKALIKNDDSLGTAPKWSNIVDFTYYSHISPSLKSIISSQMAQILLTLNDHPNAEVTLHGQTVNNSDDIEAFEELVNGLAAGRPSAAIMDNIVYYMALVNGGGYGLGGMSINATGSIPLGDQIVQASHLINLEVVETEIPIIDENTGEETGEVETQEDYYIHFITTAYLVNKNDSLKIKSLSPNDCYIDIPITAEQNGTYSSTFDTTNIFDLFDIGYQFIATTPSLAASAMVKLNPMAVDQNTSTFVLHGVFFNTNLNEAQQILLVNNPNSSTFVIQVKPIYNSDIYVTLNGNLQNTIDEAIQDFSNALDHLPEDSKPISIYKGIRISSSQLSDIFNILENNKTPHVFINNIDVPVNDYHYNEITGDFSLSFYLEGCMMRLTNSGIYISQMVDLDNIIRAISLSNNVGIASLSYGNDSFTLFKISDEIFSYDDFSCLNGYLSLQEINAGNDIQPYLGNIQTRGGISIGQLLETLISFGIINSDFNSQLLDNEDCSACFASINEIFGIFISSATNILDSDNSSTVIIPSAGTYFVGLSDNLSTRYKLMTPDSFLYINQYKPIYKISNEENPTLILSLLEWTKLFFTNDFIDSLTYPILDGFLNSNDEIYRGPLQLKIGNYNPVLINNKINSDIQHIWCYNLDPWLIQLKILKFNDNIRLSINIKINQPIEIKLEQSDWDNNNQNIISIDGLGYNENTDILTVIPKDTSEQDYLNNQVYLASGSGNSLTFKCTTIPSVDIWVIINNQEVSS